MRILILVAMILLSVNAASADLQEKWVLEPYGSIEDADFVADILPGHEYYLGYDFVGVNIYSNETARMAVNVVNQDNRLRSAMLIMNILGRSESEVISIAPGSSKLVESGLFPYKSGNSFETTTEGLKVYDIFINLAADFGQPQLTAKLKMANETFGLGNWFTGLYNY
jgi:hypothetical protein